MSNDADYRGDEAWLQHVREAWNRSLERSMRRTLSNTLTDPPEQNTDEPLDNASK